LGLNIHKRSGKEPPFVPADPSTPGQTPSRRTFTGAAPIADVFTLDTTYRLQIKTADG
jgi:hypothetical protein